MIHKELLTGVKAFIETNGIDWRNTPTRVIVAGYFAAQNDAIELAAKQIQEQLERELPSLD
jgi:hypothetical protein